MFAVKFAKESSFEPPLRLPLCSLLRLPLLWACAQVCHCILFFPSALALKFAISSSFAFGLALEFEIASSRAYPVAFWLLS